MNIRSTDERNALGLHVVAGVQRRLQSVTRNDIFLPNDFIECLISAINYEFSIRTN